MKKLLLCFLIFNITTLFASDKNEINKTVNIHIPKSSANITRIHHVGNSTKITLNFTGRPGFYTGGKSAMKLNGRVFKYFYLNGKKYKYSNQNIRKIIAKKSYIVLVFNRINTKRFSLTECSRSGCWNVYSVNSHIELKSSKNSSKKSLATVTGLDPNGDGFLSLRSKPKGREIGKLYNGNKVKILKKKGKYYKVKVVKSGMVGYAHGNWIRKSHTSNSSNTSTSHKQGTVHGLDPNGDGFLSLRNKPKGREIGKLYNGDRVDILVTRGKWYKVKLANSGQVGWAHGNWVRINKNIHLKWLSEADSSMTWSEASTFCQIYGGRLPTIEEYRQVIVNCGGNTNKNAENINKKNIEYKKCYKSKAFTGYEGSWGGQYYWTSTSFSSHEKAMSIVGFLEGDIRHGSKKDVKRYVRCVAVPGKKKTYTVADLKENPKNKYIALEVIKKYGKALQYVDKSLTKNKNIVLAAVKQDPFSFNYGDSNLTHNDRDIMLEAVKKYTYALSYASNELKKDKEIVLTAIKEDGDKLEYVDASFQDNKEIVMLAVSNNDEALRYASDRLKNDKEVVLTAIIKKDGFYYGGGSSSLAYASSNLKNDKDFILNVVRFSPPALKYISEHLKKDKKIVMAAVKERGYALSYAHASLRKDKEVVSQAMESKSMNTFEDADSSLREDKQFILMLLKKHSASLWEHVSSSLKNDREFVLEAVKANGYILVYIKNKEILDDKEIVMNALKENGMGFSYVSDRLKRDKEIITIAVNKYHYALDSVDKELRKDKDLILATHDLKYASQKLKNNKQFILSAVKKRGAQLEYAKYIDKDIVLTAVKENGGVLSTLSDNLKKDRDIVLAAVLKNGETLKYAHSSLKKDRDIVLAAVRQTGYALADTDPYFQQDKEIVFEALKENIDSFEYADKSLRSDRAFVIKAVKEDCRALMYADTQFFNDSEIMSYCKY